MGNVHKIPFVDSMGDPAFTSERPVSGSSKVGSLLSSPVSASTKTPVPFPEDLSTTITKKTVMYAGAAYCPSVSAGNWTCGRYCDANPDFVIGYSGGDGSVKQRFFIGWNPPTKEIVVGRQGSDLTQFVSWLYLVGFLQTKLDEEVAKTFSRLPNSVRAASPQSDKALASSGFQTAWKQTYAEVKAQVQAQLASHPDAVRIFVTGHSLGAAIAVLDAIALRNVAPTGVQVENFVYNRITNHKDPIPHLFSSSSGYEHSSNEIWIPEAKSNSTSPALLCPGRENMNCANSQVSNLDLLEHPGKSFGKIPGKGSTEWEAPGSIDGF
ncbi:unnamed protein product [Tilletia controversa]|nr:unnamed protein product [Tilletia controversa]CAD6936208.1 unnamed protein product [Tilletia controversa]